MVVENLYRDRHVGSLEFPKPGDSAAEFGPLAHKFSLLYGGRGRVEAYREENPSSRKKGSLV